MKLPLESIFPDDIGDATAAELTEILFKLAGAADSKYFAKIVRYEMRQRKYPDPDHPWQRSDYPEKPAA
jgi:hypothetical protein